MAWPVAWPSLRDIALCAQALSVPYYGIFPSPMRAYVRDVMLSPGPTLLVRRCIRPFRH